MTIVVRRSRLAETMSDYLVREIGYTDVIRVEADTPVVTGGGDGRPEWVATRNLRTGAETRRTVAALFLLLGEGASVIPLVHAHLSGLDR